MHHIGLCPACKQGVRGIRQCHTHGVIVCEECDAVWTAPEPADDYAFPQQPDLPCPICSRSLWGEGTHWASEAEIAALGWSDRIAGQTERDEPVSSAGQRRLAALVVGEPDLTQPWVEAAADSDLWTLAGAERLPENWPEGETDAFLHTITERMAALSGDDVPVLLLPRDMTTDRDPEAEAAARGRLLLAAAEAGLHVLAEMPWGESPAAVGRLRDAVARRGHNLQPMAMWRDHPRTLALRGLISESGIGTPRRLTLAHSVARGQRPIGELLAEAIAATLWLLGSTAGSVRIASAVGDPNDVASSEPTGLVASLRLPHTIATLDVSTVLPHRQWIEIAGENGSLVCDDLFGPPAAQPARFWIHGGNINQPQSFEPVDQKRTTLEAFARSILLGQGLPDETVADAAALADRILAQRDG